MELKKRQKLYYQIERTVLLSLISDNDTKNGIIKMYLSLHIVFQCVTEIGDYSDRLHSVFIALA